jgi:hypothetical protein
MKLTEEIKKHVNGATFVSIDTLTNVELTGGKKNPLQGRVKKLMEGANCMVFQNIHVNSYEQMVKRRLEQEGKDPSTFTLGARAWGVRDPNSPIIQHDGKDYLEVIFLHPGKVTYLVDGKETDPTTITGLKAHKEGAQGGLSDKVIIRTFAMDSIVKIKIDKHVFINK